jgi:hypothetical protein
MSLFTNLLGSSAAAPIEAIGNVFDKVFTSDEERKQVEAVLEKIKQHPRILQIELNKVEAQHRSVFVAGWRPFIGWVCGMALLYSFIVSPILFFVFEKIPEINTTMLFNLVIAMLGMSSLRTYEKQKGISK